MQRLKSLHHATQVLAALRFGLQPQGMKRLLQLCLVLFAILPGLAASLVSGYYVFQDWGSLNRSYARWEHLAYHAGASRALEIADTQQNAFRINCFADGVGVLLGAILLAIGLLGLLLSLPRVREH
jgi:hypothetical protein